MASLGIFPEIEGANNLFPSIAPQERESERSEKDRRELNALSIEFVAKMQCGRGAQAAIAEMIESSVEQAVGFAGCLILVADEEKRLVTAMTFWSGPSGVALSKSREAWVRRALVPAMEHCLRAGWFQTSAMR